MRFSTLVSSTLLVGFAAALPAPYGSGSSTVSSAASSYTSGYSSSSSSSGYQQSSSSGYSSSSSSSSGDCSSGDCSSSSSSSGSDCSNGDCNSYSSSSVYDSSSYTSTAYDSGSTAYDSSSAVYDSTSTAYDSSSTVYDSSSTVYDSATSTADVTTTYSYSAASSTATYGSGSTNWGGSGYNDCVQQCIASYGAPAATWTPSATQGSSDSGSYSGSTGTGVTHTVIVAPTQGVLRYVPFAVNASVGDTVLYVWHANNHTVTKSSALEVCNKTSDAPFASGEQNMPFQFTQVVNDTNPTFFYCGTPGHCQKGMFGMINPPSAYMTSTSVAQTMPAAVANSSDMAAMNAYTNMYTQNNTQAASWGSNIDLASLPEWSHSLVLENVMYTRTFLGANPETLQPNGFIDLGGSTPQVYPADMSSINNAVDNASSSSAAVPASSSAASAVSSTASSAPTGAAGNKNGAASTAASTALFGVAAIAAAVLAF